VIKKEGKDDVQKGIGERFQEETKYTPERIGGYTLDWDSVPPPYKDYHTYLERITLPQPEATGDSNLWGALQHRRSRRKYIVEQSLSLQQLSSLLWATQGSTARWGEFLFRTAPSAGGLYPVETYLSVRAVEGLKAGIYHFRPKAFDLEYLRQGDYSPQLARAALDQSILSDAQATFIWSALMERAKWKYRQRAYRYIYLDAGHICENLYLAAEALGLGVCAIGAFYDDRVNEIVELDGEAETVIYLATVGVRDESEYEWQ
jgi:SagB-type dehydrogenase family enzyme